MREYVSDDYINHRPFKLNDKNMSSMQIEKLKDEYGSFYLLYLLQEKY